ncbi:MAG: NUDIX domain-containing protein [Colwellia sp.]|nr:NUDIX domain-containing protein [Colwellia sp.]
MIVHECVAFILIDEAKVLLEQRSLHEGSGPALLNIPGGHIETGEDQVAALARELTEELSVKLDSHQFLCSLYYPATELQLIHYYVITKWSGVIKAVEAEAVYWHKIAEAPLAGDTDKIALSEYIRLSNCGAITF